MRTFPPLTQNIQCDVAVIGGRITGALIVDKLSSNGSEVIVFE